MGLTRGAKLSARKVEVVVWDTFVFESAADADAEAEAEDEAEAAEEDVGLRNGSTGDGERFSAYKHRDKRREGTNQQKIEGAKGPSSSLLVTT
jgi:hypothetical protein